MLRITDRLEEGLIFDVLKWDEVNHRASIQISISKVTAS